MKKSLLVISGNATFLEQMAAIQPKIAPGCDLVTVATFTEALTILGSVIFDAIILGLKNPDEHDLMVGQCEQLAKRFPKTTISIFNTRSVKREVDLIDVYRHSVSTSVLLQHIFGQGSDITARA